MSATVAEPSMASTTDKSDDPLDTMKDYPDHYGVLPPSLHVLSKSPPTSSRPSLHPLQNAGLSSNYSPRTSRSGTPIQLNDDVLRRESPGPPAMTSRFKPQLIETSRRSHRTGDVGPASKPTDKTDITPYTKHIYSPNTYQHHPTEKPPLSAHDACPASPSTSTVLAAEPTHAHRESIDGPSFFQSAKNHKDALSEIQGSSKKEARVLREAALTVFPNSHAREGGVAHFYFRDSSEDDSSGSAESDTSSTPQSPASSTPLDTPHTIPQGDECTSRPSSSLDKDEQATIATATASQLLPEKKHLYHPPPALRRNSSDIGYWFKMMQDHVEKKQREETLQQKPEIAKINASNEIKAPPKKEPLRISMLDPESDDEDFGSPLGESDASPPNLLWLTNSRAANEDKLGCKNEPRYSVCASDTPVRGPTEFWADDMMSQKDGREFFSSDMKVMSPFVNIAELMGATPKADTGDAALSTVAKLPVRLLSPPLLGKDIVFPRFQSPQHTMLEPELSFEGYGACAMSHLASRAATRNQTQGESPSGVGDDSGVGLWHGYCSSKDLKSTNGDAMAIRQPRYLDTPYVPSLSSGSSANGSSTTSGGGGDLFSEAFKVAIAEENHSYRARQLEDDADAYSNDVYNSSANTTCSDRHPVAKHQEVSVSPQVQLVLDPSSYEEEDDELTAIPNGEAMTEEFNDEFITQVYNYLSLGFPATARSFDEELSKITKVSIAELQSWDTKQAAQGHMFDLDVSGIPEEERCPRWRALKLYISEWARQHPDLENLNPLAWGVAERRGSWAA